MQFRGFGTLDDMIGGTVYFDSNPPTISAIQVHYPLGTSAAKNNSWIFVTAYVTDSFSGVECVQLNVSSVNATFDSVNMYDDGAHSDGPPGDGIYGTDYFLVDNTTISGQYFLPLTASDRLKTLNPVVANNNSAAVNLQVRVDNDPPTISNAQTIYPPGQSAAKFGDEVRVTATVHDTGPVSGIYTVRCNASQIGEGIMEPMYDDGLHADGVAGDDIWCSDLLTVGSWATCVATINITALDQALNPSWAIAFVTVDNSPPQITNAIVEYDSGGTSAQDGDEVNVTATVADNLGIIPRMHLDASSIGGSMQTLNTSFGRWNGLTVNTGFDTGSFPVIFHAFDRANNEATGTGYVTVVNANLAISIISPVNGATVTGEVQVVATVSPNIMRAELTVDSTLISINNTISGGFVSLTVQTSVFSDGLHTLSVAGYSTGGNTISDIVTAVFDNDVMSLSIINPTVGMVLCNQIPVMVDVGSQILLTELYVDSSIVGVNNSKVGSSMSLNLDTTIFDDGVHTLKVVGYDLQGGSQMAVVTVTFDNMAPTITDIIINGGFPGTIPMATVLLEATISDEGTGISDVIASSSAFDSDTYLVDDGTGDDSIAGDGIWSGSMTVTAIATEGSYAIFIDATDLYGRVRTAVAFLQVYGIGPSAVEAMFVAPANNSFMSNGFLVQVFAELGTSAAEVTCVEISHSQQPGVWLQTVFNDITGLWEHEFPQGTFSDGPVSILLKARNIFGLESPPRWVDIVVDTTSPTLQVVQPQNGYIIFGSYQLRINASDTSSGVDTASVKFSIDGGVHYAMSACAPGAPYNYIVTWDTTSLPDGEHTIMFYATDHAGNSITNSVGVIVDNNVVSPLTCQIVNPTANEFRQGILTFQVYATDANGVHNVSINIKNADYMITVLDAEMIFNPASGMWEYSLNTEFFADGNYSFWAISYDNTGNMANDNVAFHIDNQSPELSVSNPSEGQAVYGVWFVAASSDDIFLASIEYRIDLGQWWNAAIIWNTLLYADGPHTLTVRARDMIGHETAVTMTVYVNNMVPQLQIASPAPDSFVSGIATLRFWASDANGVASVMFSILEGGINPTPYTVVNAGFNQASGYWEYQLDTATLADGFYTIEAWATDTFGLMTGTVYRNFSVGNGSPWVHLVSPVGGEACGGIVRIECEISDTFPVLTEYRVDSGPWNALIHESGMTYAADWDTTAHADGLHIITARAMNAHLGVTEESVSVYVNNQLPVCYVVSPVVGTIHDGILQLKFYAHDENGIKQVTFTTYLDGDPNPTYKNIQTGYNSASGYWEYSLDTTTIDNGICTIYANATDNFGQVTVSNIVSYGIDSAVPTLTVSDPVNGQSVSNTWNIVASANDVWLLAVEYMVDAGPWTSIATPWNTASNIDGPHTLSVRARDQIGHETTVSMTVYVNNNNPICQIVYPLAGGSVTDNIDLKFSASDANGISGVRFTISDAAFTPILLDVSAIYSSGSGCWEFPLDTSGFAPGIYYLNCTAYDSFGQFTLSPNTQFTISITWVDSDGDGMADHLDAFPLDPTEWADSDGDLVGDNSDAFPTDPTEWQDSDSDGIGDNSDPYPYDYDNDGYDDYVDMFPMNPNEWNDTDADGIGDNSDPYPNDPLNQPASGDSDGDGYLDGMDLFPLNPNEWNDTDCDGFGDNSDPYPDDPLNIPPPDMDGDGVPDAIDPDRDGDGMPNDEDAFPDNPNEWSDMDGDGIGDNTDLDIDGDGVGNALDFYPYNATAWLLPTDALSDMDGDGIPDSEDLDIDGDGIGNSQDYYPYNASAWQPPVSAPSDMDRDGIPDSEDLDMDGDGWNNDVELLCGSDPQDATSVPQDTDDDGIPDALDLDLDGDGVLNEMDAYPYDSTRSQILAEATTGLGGGDYLSLFAVILLVVAILVGAFIARPRKEEYVQAAEKPESPQPASDAEAEAEPATEFEEEEGIEEPDRTPEDESEDSSESESAEIAGKEKAEGEIKEDETAV